MKNFFAVILAAVLVLSLGACGSTQKLEKQIDELQSKIDNLQETQSSSSTDSSNADNKKLEDLEKHLKDAGVLSGETVQMAAELIGAAQGIKYKTSTGNVELYYFDKDNLSELGKKNIDSITSNKTFLIDGIDSDQAVSAYNEPFLLICDECSNKDEIITAFNNY